MPGVRPGRSAWRFVADHVLATSDLVVARSSDRPPRPGASSWATPSAAEPPAAVLSQRWQIAPLRFRASPRDRGDGRRPPRERDRECAASVVAVIGPDQGATVTGCTARRLVLAVRRAGGGGRSRPSPRPRARVAAPVADAPPLSRRHLPSPAPDAHSAAPTPPVASDPAAGLRWTLPAGWRPVPSRLTALAQPVHGSPRRRSRCGGRARSRLRAGHGAGAAAGRRRARLPARGSRGRGAAKALGRYPARPAHFRVGRARGTSAWGSARSCGGPSRAARSRRRSCSAARGPRAGGGRSRRCWTRSSSRRSHRRRRPPAGDPSISGAYDSMRVPPGWQAHALRRVHTTPRPRRLFRLANRDGTVVVRVTEHRRGRPRRRSPRHVRARLRRRTARRPQLPRLPVLDPHLGPPGRERERPRVGGDQRALTGRLGCRAGLGLRCRPRSSPCRTPSPGGCAWGGR